MDNKIPAYLLGRIIAEFEYTNWRGETEVRTIIPDRVVWMDTPDFGYKPGWFLIGWDMKRKAFRQFAFDPERMRPSEADGQRIALSVHGTNILWQAGR
jgi:predicted DNA-binding transcriptional regulator YafY